jgi:hypothetical protein
MVVIGVDSEMSAFDEPPWRFLFLALQAMTTTKNDRQLIFDTN